MTAIGGPFSLGAIGLVTYSLIGVSVVDVSRELYLFVETALGARSDEDFDKAGEYFAKGMAKAAVDAGMALSAAGVGKAVKAVAGSKRPAKVDADNRVHIDAPPQPKPPAKPATGGAIAGLSEVVAQLRLKLIEALGEAVVKAVTKNVEGDSAKLAETLEHLDTLLKNVKAWRGGSGPEKWLAQDAQVQTVLKRIFIDNMKPGGAMSQINPEHLLRDLADISHIEGFVPTLRQMMKPGPSVKGVVGEVLEAAEDLRKLGKYHPTDNPNGLEAVNKIIMRMQDGKLKKWTDIDIISEGTLWQVKAGPNMSWTPNDFYAWAVKAAQHAREIGRTKVGFRLDQNAAHHLQKQAIIDKLSLLRKEYPDIEFITRVVDAIPIP